MKNVILFLMILVPSISHASVVNCNNVYIKSVSVQGIRDDGFQFENELILTLIDANGQDVNCSGKQYIYLSNSDANYPAMLSIAMAAKMSGKAVNISVNTSSSTSISNRLAIISLAP